MAPWPLVTARGSHFPDICNPVIPGLATSHYAWGRQRPHFSYSSDASLFLFPIVTFELYHSSILCQQILNYKRARKLKGDRICFKISKNEGL
ncbi:hypothetical protein CEXT_518821 [Caerostris extrusa]|uniref:Uncharacterized protein n=1 Tax=Caerostris extrusa TaxID=172846 RepID=A0AAV4P3D2_CAEEX|nr:hypothetical protein CEXT_518821 [Caerostris extrusa]